jgi:hypothetical protein
MQVAIDKEKKRLGLSAIVPDIYRGEREDLPTTPKEATDATTKDKSKDIDTVLDKYDSKGNKI